jgi:hypothetical protein
MRPPRPGRTKSWSLPAGGTVDVTFCSRPTGPCSSAAGDRSGASS